jgi:hypothetical protein
MADRPFSDSDLIAFIRAAIAYAWPNNFVPTQKPDLPGFNETHYGDGPWNFVDLWAGGMTDMGFEIVTYDDVATWGAAYRGGVIDEALGPAAIYAFLAEALRSPHDSAFPLRGPAAYRSADGQWLYRFNVSGGVESFTAVEEILYRDSVVYQRVLTGGYFGDRNPYGPRVPLAASLFE